MPHTTCAHCGTKITDHATLTERRGSTYCCVNCAAMAEGTTGSSGERCRHCESVITDQSTMVRSDGNTYCCVNCARAMGATIQA